MHEMVKKRGKPNDGMQAWIDARKRHGLSHAEVQMARVSGINPQKLGKLDNHHQEPWKSFAATRKRRRSGAKLSYCAGKAKQPKRKNRTVMRIPRTQALPPLTFRRNTETGKSLPNEAGNLRLRFWERHSLRR